MKQLYTDAVELLGSKDVAGADIGAVQNALTALLPAVSEVHEESQGLILYASLNVIHKFTAPPKDENILRLALTLLDKSIKFHGAPGQGAVERLVKSNLVLDESYDSVFVPVQCISVYSALLKKSGNMPAGWGDSVLEDFEKIIRTSDKPHILEACANGLRAVVAAPDVREFVREFASSLASAARRKLNALPVGNDASLQLTMQPAAKIGDVPKWRGRRNCGCGY